jgi:hypothetical protein
MRANPFNRCLDTWLHSLRGAHEGWALFPIPGNLSSARGGGEVQGTARTMVSGVRLRYDRGGGEKRRML